MTWTLFRQQQQLGAQLPPQPGDPPREAVDDRAAQEHELPGSTAPKGGYPASRLQDRTGDNTPSAGDPRVEWDDIVQPQRQGAAEAALQPGETELDGDERGDDAEQVPDAQAEQALRDASMEQDAAELDDEAPGDRND